MKLCAKCGQKDRDKSGECRVCRKTRSKIWYIAHKKHVKTYNAINKEKKKIYQAEWYKINKEKVKNYRAIRYTVNKEKAKSAATAWQAVNPEKVKATRAAYYIKNSEKAKARARAWRIANPKKVKIANMLWAAANPERKKVAYAVWYAANPEKSRIYWQNRHARKRDNGGTLSKGLSERLYKRQKGKCVCCHKPLGDNFHLDHIMPIKLGGKNEDWNIQLLRAECNRSKYAKHPLVYMRQKGFLI